MSLMIRPRAGNRLLDFADDLDPLAAVQRPARPLDDRPRQAPLLGAALLLVGDLLDPALQRVERLLLLPIRQLFALGRDNGIEKWLVRHRVHSMRENRILVEEARGEAMPAIVAFRLVALREDCLCGYPLVSTSGDGRIRDPTAAVTFLNWERYPR